MKLLQYRDLRQCGFRGSPRYYLAGSLLIIARPLHTLLPAEARMADETLASCLETLSGVFILGGDIMPAQNREHLGGLGWRSLEGLEEDKTGPMPSYERVKAGSCLHRMNPRLLLIPSGGKSNLPTAADSPLIATVMAAELRELGVPSKAIIEETQSFTTQDHFVHCSKIARARRWNSAEIRILAPFWQFGRVTAMMMMMMRAEQYGSIDPFVLGVTPLISVERALASEDPIKWNKYFKDLYENPVARPLFPRKRKSIRDLAMSQTCQNRL
jgi:hypothetical protein